MHGAAVKSVGCEAFYCSDLSRFGVLRLLYRSCDSSHCFSEMHQHRLQHLRLFSDCVMADNQQSGLHYEPSLSRIEQRELVRWIAAAPERKLLLPSAGAEVELRQDEPVYLVTTGADRTTDRVYNIRVNVQ